MDEGLLRRGQDASVPHPLVGFGIDIAAMLDPVAAALFGFGGLHRLIGADQLVDGGVANGVADHGIAHGGIASDQIEKLIV